MKKFIGLLVVVLAVSFAFTGCAKKGEALWKAACEHALDLSKADMKKADEKAKEMSKEDIEKGMKECTEGIKALGDGADEAANCIMAAKDMKAIGECYGKAMEKKAKEGDKKKEGEEKPAEEKPAEEKPAE